MSNRTFANAETVSVGCLQSRHRPLKQVEHLNDKHRAGCHRCQWRRNGIGELFGEQLAQPARTPYQTGFVEDRNSYGRPFELRVAFIGDDAANEPA